MSALVNQALVGDVLDPRPCGKAMPHDEHVYNYIHPDDLPSAVFYSTEPVQPEPLQVVKFRWAYCKGVTFREWVASRA